ncbi:MAG: D-alanyl-D-alanine carboxypeptidase/D-alanyl-D-alanine-endopeptidase [Gloeomargaritaceae cyanobacterium C42_A2020_066]|nr:D-alanyl-D-alanine carboxypeptidase/D-alanyl-D-alanine-endopeptidase [Gloeomargaritaceae cyanobacterium C42_A2020_066]
MAQNSSPVCAQDLPQTLEALFNRPAEGRTRWGALVQTEAETPTTLYDRAAARYFLPASTTKLLTTAAAFLRLGPDYRARTVLYREPPTTLRLVGGGDPTLTQSDLERMAAAAGRAGVRRVERLILDTHQFQGPAWHDQWAWQDFVEVAVAPVPSLILDRNQISLTLTPQAAGRPLRVTASDPQAPEVRALVNQTQTVAAGADTVQIYREPGRPAILLTGELPVTQPPLTLDLALADPVALIGQRLQRALQAQGIRVERVQILTTPAAGRGDVLAFKDSPPLVDWATTINQASDNLYAETLIRQLGVGSSLPGQTTLAAGLTEVRRVLAEQGVDPTHYRQADGSGLSRHNLISPAALVGTLQAMARTPYATAFRQSLAVPGGPGTLTRRLVDTPAAGRVAAKTGTLAGVATLAGYVRPAGHPPLVFAFLANQSDQPSARLRQTLDQAVVILSQLQVCN